MPRQAASGRSSAAGGAPASDRLPRGPLAFRFGFCAVATEALDEKRVSALPQRNWTERRIGWLTLRLHREADVQVVDAGRRRFVFIGDVYSIAESGLAEQVAVLPDGDEGALYDLLDDLSGRFALIVIEGDRARVFHDPMGARSVFYHDRPPFAVASHATLLAAAIGARKSRNIADFMADPGFKLRKTSSLPGDRSIYQHIHALVPNNLLDSEGIVTRRYWPRAVRRPGSQEQFHQAADAALAALARHVRGRYVPVFGATGGVDSRAGMAGFRSLGAPFETMTYKRDQLTARESKIVTRLNATLATTHVDILAASGAGSLARLTKANSGGLKSHWKAAAAVRPVFGDRRDAVFLRGMGAEVLRGYYNHMPTQMRDLSPEEMARAYFDPSGAKQPPAGTLAYFKGYHRRANYAGVEAFGYDPNDLFYWEHRMGMWGAMCHNEMDVAIRTLACFNCRRLYMAALGLPPEIRLTKRLLHSYIARVDPDLARVAIYRERSAAVAQRHAPAQKRRPRPD